MDDTAGDRFSAYRRANVDGTRAVLDAARAAGARTFVFASSVKAVGERSETPWTESVEPRPVDPYGVSKLEGERVVLGAAAIRAVVLRLPLVYGPGVRANMLRLFRAVDSGWPLPVGGVKNRRSLLYVGNLVAAIRRALEVDRVRGTYFLADGEGASTEDLVRAIARALG
jgi:UDP-glucose 4-epimerase